MRTQEELNKLFTDADFNCVDTGGGCLAWMHELENGDEILVSNFDSDIPRVGDKEIGVGLWSADGEELAVWYNLTSVEEALHVAKWDVLEYYYKKEQEDK